MIDFRYHLVSLVSVFIALAVGILLGAGPLQQPLEQGVSATFQQQIDSLRQDRQSLRDQLDSSQAAVGHRDEVVSEVTPALVKDRLAGRTVVLVVLPEAATDRVGDLTGDLEAAGAGVVGRIEIKADWTDPAKATDRARLAARLVSGLPAGSPAPGGADAGPDEILAALLARAVATTSESSGGTEDPVATVILDGLREAGLVSLSGNLGRRGGLAVLLAPAVESATVTAPTTPSAGASPTATATPDAARPWNPLALALDNAAVGGVVVGPGSAATAGGVLADVRGDGDLEDKVSSVDTGGTEMGDLTTVLALAEQADGGAGAYGFGAGASAPLPELVTAPALTVPSAQATATP